MRRRPSPTGRWPRCWDRRVPAAGFAIGTVVLMVVIFSANSVVLFGDGTFGFMNGWGSGMQLLGH
jgi:hypothetical protein